MEETIQENGAPVKEIVSTLKTARNQSEDLRRVVSFFKPNQGAGMPVGQSSYKNEPFYKV